MPYKHKEDRNRNSRNRYHKDIELSREENRIKQKRQRQNPEHRANRNEDCRDHYKKVRTEVLLHYSNGNPKCAKCGFSDIRALCLDHLQNGGNEHRKELRKTLGNTGHYVWIIKNNFPKNYQLLCYNCNLIKGIEYSAKKRADKICPPLN